MTYVAVAGLFIVYLITEYPAPACAAGALALWLLCRAAGSLVPAAAFAVYCALTALAYAAGKAFFHPSYLPGMGGLAPLGVMVALFPVIFGALWLFLRRLM